MYFYRSWDIPRTDWYIQITTRDYQRTDTDKPLRFFARRTERAGRRRYTLRLGGPFRVDLVTGEKSLKELVGLEFGMGRFVRDFPYMFDDAVAAAMDYKLNHSLYDYEQEREAYEDIIRRLREPEPEFTPEEVETLYPEGRRRNEDEIQREVFKAYRQRVIEYIARKQQARQDMVELVWGNWTA